MLRHDAVVSMEEVSKSYPGVLAPRRVSLDLHAGEVHALVGENGAGKSTLIKILSGDARPDRGATLVRGRRGIPSNRPPMHGGMASPRYFRS